jgi:hypothetical protein
MSKSFVASEDLSVETTQDMDPHRPGTSVLPGRARAHLTVYEPGDECSDTLPTIADLLSAWVDRSTGLITLDRIAGLDLKFDPAPLRELPPNLRVSPGYSFVTYDALRRMKDKGVR